jgi:cytochrome bd-I ubiquinol oxidase subunit X
MWYFTWILGLGLALAFGIVNVMWLEARTSRASYTTKSGCVSASSGAGVPSTELVQPERGSSLPCSGANIAINGGQHMQ